jgi:hypothetical protein
MDDFTAGQRLAVGEATGLAGNLLMGDEGESQGGVPTRPLVCRQRGGGLDLRLGSLRHHHGLSRCQHLRFRLPDPTHKDFPLPPTLPPKPTHNLGEVLVQLLGLRLQGRALGGTLLRDLRKDLEDFFSPWIRSPQH